MKNRFKITLFLFISVISVNVQAWNGRGHMVVASIAYQNLSDSARIYYTDILKHHESYKDWEKEYDTIRGVDFGEFLFMKASTWPDDIRNSGNLNDHPTWHYVSYAIDFEKGHRKTDTNDTNALTAMKWSLATVHNTEATGAERAAALCWFIHLAGDIHQPLHAGSLFNTMFPQGDRGGNLVYVKMNDSAKAVKLHSYWDGLPGWFGKPKNYAMLRYQAENLEAAHTLKSCKKKVKNLDFAAWSYESFDLAVSKAQRNGEIARLPGIDKESTAPVLLNSAKYEKEAHETADKRVALAGYRMAKVLEIKN